MPSSGDGLGAEKPCQKRSDNCVTGPLAFLDSLTSKFTVMSGDRQKAD
jgi:hypothetical protein